MFSLFMGVVMEMLQLLLRNIRDEFLISKYFILSNNSCEKGALTSVSLPAEHAMKQNVGDMENNGMVHLS